MINEINVLKRNIGLVYSNNSTLIWLWAPFANLVSIKLNFTVLKLEKQEHGYWFMKTDLIKPGDKYYFLLNNQEQLPDPASLSQPEGVNGISEVVDLSAFNWDDQDWKNISLRSYLFYELHTGTFNDPGTFTGIISKLDYLVNLGITAIELMPVAQFPGTRNWGYDGVYPFAVQHSYGGAQGLQELVNACHSKGLAIVLDVVYNHIGPEGNHFSKYGPYFTEKYSTPWGSAVNFDDAWSDGVRNYFIENVLMWFRDFHIDALRLDAVHAIKDFSAQHLLSQIRREVDKLMQETGKIHYLIVESDLNDTRFIDSLEKCGYGMDAQWIDEFHHALRVTAGGARSGYYSDFNGILHLEKAYKDAYVYDGVFSAHRNKTFGSKADFNPGHQFIVFSQNHDQVGNQMLGERSSQLFNFETQKLMAGAVLCSPFLPMLFMGEEWAETNPFLYFVSHSDPDLIKAVQKGRKHEFAAFHSESKAPDPQSETTFENSKLQWDLNRKDKHAIILNFYRAVIKLRKMNPPLNCLDRSNSKVHSDVSKNCLMLLRWYENQQVLCLLNFSSQEQSWHVSENYSGWNKIFDSADPEWAGSKASPLIVHADLGINIQPQSFLVYSNYITHV